MSGSDPDVYPGTGVLRNKLDIRDPAALELAEAALVSARQVILDTAAIPLTPDGLRTIHRFLFQDVYDWAGEFRRTDISKVIDARHSIAFAPAAFVGVGVRRFFGELAGDNCLRDLDAPTFAYRAAVYLDDLNVLHPFREGNGRTQRVWLKTVAAQAGHAIDLTRLDRTRWIAGARECFGQGVRGQHAIMAALIQDAIHPMLET